MTSSFSGKAPLARGPVPTLSGPCFGRGSAIRSCRPLSVFLIALALAFAGPACKRKEPRQLSVVEMSNPTARKQLLTGFYGLEAGAWRWTAKEFAVELAVPPEAARNGAWLRVRLATPDALIDKLGSITLSSTVGGQALDPQTYSAAGNYTYQRPVPASLLQGASATVDFTLDKVMRPGGADVRDLGIVVLGVGLEPR